MKLLIISNRLPFTAVERGGELYFKPSAGGLVSGISSYLDYLKKTTLPVKEYVWVGWPGIPGTVRAKEELKSRALSDFNVHPVILPEKTMEKFYHGFCNKIIWPLFHYFPSLAVYDPEYWKQYVSINEIFCNAVMEIAQPQDLLWIHDYHLMLLPRLLRERMPGALTGFFLHIPFPSQEIFRLLPSAWRRNILEGLLGADLIGFHTNDYTQHFLRCVLRILGHESSMGKIILEDRVVKADTFPMGIDFKRYHEAAGDSGVEVEKEKELLRKNLADFKVILSVDRLDYTKGIVNRLNGFEIFLEKNPQWRKRAVMVLIVVPSRIGVEHYQEMKKRVDETVGRINGRFGSVEWNPILYQYRFLPFHSLVAAYAASDVALITPLRDGMNLIAKEYVASRTEQTGVLILSEMAGASKEMGESIIVNPNDVEEIARVLREALEMPHSEQVRRNRIMQERLKSYDVVRWANDFLEQLFSIRREQERLKARLMDASTQDHLVDRFRKARRRLIFMDYDGTLAPFAERPELAGPTAEVIELLDVLSRDSRTEVVLISGRDRDTLESWFGGLNIHFVAEHGVWMRERAGDWKLMRALTTGWKSSLLPLLETYTSRVPGSFIEDKKFSMAWHYRKSDPEFASVRVLELMDELLHVTANMDVQVLSGNKVIEIRNSGVNKGTAGMYFVSKENFDFIMAAGDDWTDEELFRVLPETAYTIRVGMVPSHSMYNLHNHQEIIVLLGRMIERGEE